MPVQELINEVLSDWAGKVLIDSLAERKLKIDQNELMEILLADAAYVYFIEGMFRNMQRSMDKRALMDFLGKFTARVAIKLVRGETPKYFQLLMDSAVGEIGSTLVESTFPQLIGR